MKSHGFQTYRTGVYLPGFSTDDLSKKRRRLRGMIDRSHQPTSEVALYNKLKALAYWIR
jgi:hypothetical protein